MDKKRRRRSNWIFCAVGIALCVALYFLPSPGQPLAAASVPRVRVKILSVDNSALYPLGIVYSGVQNCVALVMEGPWKGCEAEGSNYMNSALDKDKLFEAGDMALAMLHEDGAKISLTLVDHYRLFGEGAIFLLFGLLLILFGGISGAGALISLVVSVMVVWKALIPLLLVGVNPIWAALGTVIVLTAMIDFLVAGFTRTALTALTGSLLGTALTCALAVTFGRLLKLDGGSLPYVVPLLAQNALQLDIQSLFFSMVFLANSGALMDLSMDIASAGEEITRHRPDIPRGELVKSLFAVGRNVIGTMTTTLMLAYSGSYLSMMLYFAGQGTPVIDIFNLKYVSSEVLTTLVGSFGLVTVAPFTAIMACLFSKTGGRGLRPKRAAGAT